MTTVTIGPSQPSGRRTIADANALSLSSGDVVQFESIDESGPFATSTRLAVRAGVTYSTLDDGHPWGITGMGGVDLAVNGATLRWFKGDGGNLSGSQGIATTGEAKNITLQHLELSGYVLEALKSTHGQWQNFLNTGNANTGPDDSGWLIEDAYIHDSALAGSGSNAWFHYGSGLVMNRVTFRNAGGGDHAFYPKGRGLRMNDVLFDQCTNPLSLRCGDQLGYRIYFDQCVNPVTSFPYDKTGLGGKQALYGVVLRGCSAPGGALMFFDENNHEAGGLLQHADYDVVVFNASILDSTTGAQGFDFRDFTIAGRHVKLRNVSHGKNVTAPYRTGYTAANLDADYGAFPNGGKPAAETHSTTPTNTQVSEATLLPIGGSPLLGVGTTTGDGTDYTPQHADIGFQGYPAPASTTAVTPVNELAMLDHQTTATPGGTWTPGASNVVGDTVEYLMALNQNNLGDLTVTPPTGFTLRVSKSVTDRDAVYIATKRLAGGDALLGSGPFTMPTWLIQDATPANQSRAWVTFVGTSRGVDATAPIPAGGSAIGGNSTAQATGATATTTITTPPNGARLIGIAVGKPGQTGPTHSIDGTNSVPPASSSLPDWTKRAEQLQGTANGAAAITASVYSVNLGSSESSQAKLDVDFSVNAQWAIAVLELAPPQGSGDTTAPDQPTNLQLERQTSSSAIVKADATDYGDVTPPPPPGGGFADLGTPLNWSRLTQDGGLRPSFDSYDPSAVLGPRTNAYYANASLRDPANPANLRGTPTTGAGVKYYPRSLGLNILSIDYSDPAHFKITLHTPPPSSGPGAYANGMVVQVKDIAPTAGNANQFKPKKPNGQYTIQAIAGSIITFTTGANTTSGTYNPDSAFVIPESQARQETVLSIDVTEDTIASASDVNGPLFLKGPGAASLANPWVLQHGFANAMSITGNKSAQANGGFGSLPILIPPWFDLANCSPEYLTYGGEGDPQLYNPFCHLDFKNCHVVIQDGMGAKGLTGTKPGTAAGYSEPLSDNPITIHGVTYTGLQIPVGEAIGWGGCSGVVRGLMNHDFLYDANKFGSGAANLRWEWCSNFRNRWLVRAGGGHTDCYQIWDLINTALGPFTDIDGRVWPLAPTWYRCYFESGGNAMLFLNDGGGSGTGVISDVWALECIPGTGNKFLIAAGCHNVGARRCLINGVAPGDGGMEGQRPDALDFGSNNDTGSTQPCGQSPAKDPHPCPSGTLAWPDSSTAPDDVNLRVLIDGSTTTVGAERDYYPAYDPASSDPTARNQRLCRDGTCFTYID